MQEREIDEAGDTKIAKATEAAKQELKEVKDALKEEKQQMAAFLSSAEEIAEKEGPLVAGAADDAEEGEG